MMEKDAKPLDGPPRLSLAAAARVHNELLSVDEHNNRRFMATAPVVVSDRTGAMYEVLTVMELLALCDGVLSGEE